MILKQIDKLRDDLKKLIDYNADRLTDPYLPSDIKADIRDKIDRLTLIYDDLYYF